MKDKDKRIYFSANKEASLIEDNLNDKIENTLRIINSWGKRNPTLYGKAILAKTLMLSQFPYALQALAYPETTLKKDKHNDLHISLET